MSNRRRVARRPRSYTARLQRRAPVPPQRRPRPWAAWLPAGVAVVAEAGHLIASYVEWPGSAARGASHVAAGAVLGLVAAAVVAGTGRRRFVAGAVVALAGPVWWLGGVLLGAPPYDRLPVPAAIGIAAGEIGLAALLLTAASRTPDPDASAGVVRPRAKTRTGS